MKRHEQGFTLIELMIVVIVIGFLAAIAIPNFVAMQARAREANTRTNMHTLQLIAEDYGVQHDGQYAKDVTPLIALLPGSKKLVNPYTHDLIEPSSNGHPGSIRYEYTADSLGRPHYRIYGRDTHGNDLRLVLSDGQ